MIILWKGDNEITLMFTQVVALIILSFTTWGLTKASLDVVIEVGYELFEFPDDSLLLINSMAGVRSWRVSGNQCVSRRSSSSTINLLSAGGVINHAWKEQSVRSFRLSMIRSSAHRQAVSFAASPTPSGLLNVNRSLASFSRLLLSKFIGMEFRHTPYSHQKSPQNPSPRNQ